MAIQNAPDLQFEIELMNKGLLPVGVDEVGRGCLAGPVVAAAVFLPEEVLKNPKSIKDTFWSEVNDSKKITAVKRAVLAEKIKQSAKFQITWVDADLIDEINILQASMLAMRKALVHFAGEAHAVLVDGHQSPYHDMFLKEPHGNLIEQNLFRHVTTIIGGDTRSISIAAASIIAKVYRDEWMNEFEVKYPGYGLGKHKGYSTKQHIEALSELGACEIHRKSFEPVKLIFSR